MPVRFRQAGRDPASSGREAGDLDVCAGMTGGYTASLFALGSLREGKPKADGRRKAGRERDGDSPDWHGAGSGVEAMSAVLFACCGVNQTGVAAYVRAG